MSGRPIPKPESEYTSKVHGIHLLQRCIGWLKDCFSDIRLNQISSRSVKRSAECEHDGSPYKKVSRGEDRGENERRNESHDFVVGISPFPLK